MSSELCLEPEPWGDVNVDTLWYGLRLGKMKYLFIFVLYSNTNTVVPES